MESDVIRFKRSPEVVLLQRLQKWGVGQWAGTFWHEMDLETSPSPSRASVLSVQGT